MLAEKSQPLVLDNAEETTVFVAPLAYVRFFDDYSKGPYIFKASQLHSNVFYCRVLQNAEKIRIFQN